ncbi:nose resistant to fluoxetine protein 6-like isoform X1 [Amblyomma americanum]
MRSRKRVISLLTRLFFALAVVICLRATSCVAHIEANNQTDVKIVEKLKEWIGDAIDRAPPSFMRKLLEADVSSKCSLGLLKLVRGVRNLEPWALRLLDASGKYPTGAFQLSRADLGAFDECLETVQLDEYGREMVRGQYCNLLVYATNNSDLNDLITSAMVFTHPRVRKFTGSLFEQRLPLVRLGICLLDDCTQDELQALLVAVLPLSADVSIKNCVTATNFAFTKGQVLIISFLGVLALVVLIATAVDIFSSQEDPKRRNRSALLSVLKSFSVASNTRMMLHIAREKSSDACSLRFLHGIRFFSIVWIVMGHCYCSPSDVWSRMMNMVLYADQWQSMILTAGFIGVDSFFFLSGYLLISIVWKQKRNGVVVFLFAVVRRLFRTMVPVFFLLMCLQLLPLIASGPDSKAFFEKIDEDFRRQWLAILLQVQNYAFKKDAIAPVFGHFWYLSVDFQFFLVTLPILLLLKKRPKVAVGVLALLSLVGCSIATWQVAASRKTPFIVLVTESLSTFLETGYYYYFYPFYHAVCYFTGCITFFLVSRFKTRKISLPLQAAAWCVAVSCGMGCIFMKTAWYRTRDPTTELGKLSAAFFDRILWSVFLSWITVACATGRGGFVNTFLSWSPFTPLSRLAFGVYLIHLLFIQLFLCISRERLFFSHFFAVSLFFTTIVWSYLLSYLLFICCEAPTGRLDKLVFEPQSKQTEKSAGDAAPNANGTEDGLPQVVAKLRDA